MRTSGSPAHAFSGCALSETIFRSVSDDIGPSISMLRSGLGLEKPRHDESTLKLATGRFPSVLSLSHMRSTRLGTRAPFFPVSAGRPVPATENHSYGILSGSRSSLLLQSAGPSTARVVT